MGLLMTCVTVLMGTLGFALCFAALILVLLFVIRIVWKFTSGSFKVSEDLTGKVFLITGPTSGIGLETTRTLIKHGATVYLLCRNAEKGKLLEKELGERAYFIHCELNRLESVRECAKEVLQKCSRIDVLINNAGVGTSGSKDKPKFTEDGLEYVMASNYFGHFLLTRLLLDRIRDNSHSRIVNVSSLAHRFEEHFSADNLNFEQGHYKHPYGYSKLAQILFTRELARRLYGTGVTVNVLHPGFVKTSIFGKNWKISSLATFFKNSVEGAQTSLYLAVSKEVENVSGHYFADCAPKGTTVKAVDDKLALEVWNKSCELIRVPRDIPTELKNLD